MEKVIFSVGDKVVTIEQSQLKRGVIKDIYHLGTPILIVQFENGNVEKCLVSEVAPAPVERPETEPDEKNEPTVTISEFMNVCPNILSNLTKRGLISITEGMRFTAILGLIGIELFRNESNDD